MQQLQYNYLVPGMYEVHFMIRHYFSDQALSTYSYMIYDTFLLTVNSPPAFLISNKQIHIYSIKEYFTFIESTFETSFLLQTSLNGKIWPLTITIHTYYRYTAIKVYSDQVCFVDIGQILVDVCECAYEKKISMRILNIKEIL